jgi:hypothetical protein
MKFLLLAIILLYCFDGFSQQLQLHYDARHTIAPKLNSKNYLSLYFEYFKQQDSGKVFIKPGSFLLKTQGDFSGAHNNLNKFYMQVSQSFRFWQPKIFLNFQYSGGLGVTEPKQYSYYINNTFGAGLSYPFKWANTYFTGQVSYQFTSYEKPSHDMICTLYWWKGLLNYHAEFAGDFSVWTGNKNQGDTYTSNLSGKRFYFFAEPQAWYNITKRFGAGTKVNMYYHINRSKNTFEVYPTLAVRCKL